MGATNRIAISDDVPAAVMRYGNIIFRQRPIHEGDLFSRRHPKMSRLNRAKIFAPFAALAGFEEAVRAKEINYVPKHILDADETYELNATLNLFYHLTRNSRQARQNQISARVSYFVVCSDINNDAYGRLGLYCTETGIVWRVDPHEQMLQIGNKRIAFEDIRDIRTMAGERFSFSYFADHV